MVKTLQDRGIGNDFLNSLSIAREIKDRNDVEKKKEMTKGIVSKHFCITKERTELRAHRTEENPC